MATIYCSTSGSNTSPYDTKAKAATNLDTALGAASAGDTVLLESSYVETVSAAKTFTIPAGVSVIAINYSTDKRQPMADAGGYIGRTSGSSYALTVVFGSGAYLYGLCGVIAPNWTSARITAHTTAGVAAQAVLDSCTFTNNASGSFAGIQIGRTNSNNNSSEMQLRNCVLEAIGAQGASGACRVKFSILGDMIGGRISRISPSLYSATNMIGVAGTNDEGGGSIRFIGVNLANAVSDVALVGVGTGSAAHVQIIDCRTPEYSVITDNPCRLLVDMIHSGTDSWSRGFTSRWSYAGVAYATPSIYTSDGPTCDGTIRYSIMMWSTGNCGPGTPLITPLITLYNEDDALSADLSVEVAVEDSATPLTGDKLWAEFITSSGTISSPFVYTSTFDETGGDVPAGSASWTGFLSPTVWKGKLKIPVSVILAGELRVRIVCTIPSTALYVDPQIRVT